MPNWCNNSVTITHSDTTKMQALVAAVNEGKFCDHVIPTPQDLTDTVSGSVPEGPERDAHEAQMKRNLELYGAKDWYDYQVSNWGTKWDVQPYDTVELEDNVLSFGFDSAWSPPTGVYTMLVEQGFTVKAFYYEPGMCFAGVWEDGIDEFYELDGMSSDEVANTIDRELDEVMGISASMAEYEEENIEE